MKRGFVLLICLSLVFTMFLLPGIIAPYEGESDSDDSAIESGEVTSIKLEGEGNVVEWEVEGYSASGFKLAWSMNEDPTYPPRDGDYWSYYSSPESQRAELSAKDGAGEYYVRVCEYLGGKCGLYSNQVKVMLGESESVESKETDKPKPTLYDDDDTTESSPVTSIKLEAEGNKIWWSPEGYSKSGFKVTWSKDKDPTYPTRKGDRYHYHSSPDKDHDVLDAFDGDGDYYIRVCEYLGGKCGIYSNQVQVTLNKEGKYEDDDSDDDKMCPAVCVPMWKLKKVECITAPCYPICEYDDCGSGCGVDSVKTFNTEEECKTASTKYDYSKKDDSTKESPEIQCNGCLVEEVCYPLGFRKAGQYCFDDFVFVDQSEEDVACDNNFECSSNLCLDSECISGGLIRKIMNWVKGIFGN
jgi:hypothetical protein